MPINFFEARCLSRSNNALFGICDDIANSPAYIDEHHSVNWIAIVSNSDEKEIEFYAIDNCVEIFRPNGEMESRCDGVLKDDKHLVFVELKERESGKWFKKGREQLTTTISIFLANHNAADFDTIEAYVCNSLKPRSNPGRAESIQRFFDDTGYVLQDKQTITI